MNRIKNEKAGKGSGAWMSRRPRILGFTLAAACALSLGLAGCSNKNDPSKVVVTDPPDETGPKKVVTAIDSLVKANSGQGKGVVTGYLTGEGRSVAKGLLKQASNAAGERRLLTRSVVPLEKATILIFNSLKPTTAPDTTITTNDSGVYTAVLPEGKYFGFAVYLDLQNFQLVTTSIPNINPRADTVLRMDTAIAIEDVTAPSVAGVYDANSANAEGVFLVGSVPDRGAKINVTFSEPMNRESAKGVILGRIDTSNTSTSMVLADTLKGLTFTWSGDSKELVIHAAELSTGVQYGLILPVGLKDLAKNPLEKEYKATFATVDAAELSAIKFAVAATFPADGEALKPIQNPGISFNRPAEVFSVLKNATIEPAITGYWEVSGARAVFIHREPLAVGSEYTITLPADVSDLGGAKLAGEFSYSFTVKDFEGAAKDNVGKERGVALAVETAFDAYLSGDVGRFATAFHPNFRLYGESGEIRSKTQFLDMIRADVGERQAMSAGFMGPVFDNSEAACEERAARWKVGAAGGTSADHIWVDAYVNPGQSPRAYGADKVQIPASELTWDPTGPRFTYKGKKYGFGPDMTRFSGPVNMEAARGDMRFMGDMLRQTSTVVLEEVKLRQRDEFKVDAQVTLEGDTLAKLAVKMIGYRSFNRTNFGEIDMACEGKLEDTTYQILKFMLNHDGSKWLITSIVEPAGDTKREDFNQIVDTRNFQVVDIKPITLISPLKDNGMVDGKVAFRFKGPAHDSIGGYLLGIAEDPKFCFGRPPYGALIFVKASNRTGGEETLVLNDRGAPEGSNAAAILRRVQDLRLPGWERALFESPIAKLVDVDSGFGGVYQWKVIAIRDTSAAQFLANGFKPERFFAESDFGPTRGYFACKQFPQGTAFATLENNQQIYVNTGAVGGSFNDMDQDGVPDGMEAKYKTDPRDRNSYPEFRVDTDGDRLADFLEAMLDRDGALELVATKADEAGIRDQIAKLIALGIVWQDTDGDGFPDDVEMMSGFNPNDPMNNPGTRPRANAPIGVFAGKFQMGSSLNSIGFKVFTDSAKALFVSYSAIIGRDTLADTVRTAFHDASGELLIPVTLPLSGPDAGKALLMRGRFDAIQSLLMGPVDIITAVPGTSVNFGGGPYVGQFAASGRGEDVSRFLPGSNSTGGTVTVNPPVMGPIYRMPPTGVSEGAKIIFLGSAVVLVDGLGDSLETIGNLNFRTQADGSYEFFGEKRIVVAETGYKRSEVRGRIVRDGSGTWILDGHFFQEMDSAGIRKSIPGQMNAKASREALTAGAASLEGTMTGWIAQDKSGLGFVSQPGPTTPCDPTRGPCDTQPVCDPAKGPCGPGPVTSFSRPFVSGVNVFKNFLVRAAVAPGGYFNVSLNGRVYKVKYDSTRMFDAKSPWCGQVVMLPEAYPAKSDSAHHLAAYAGDTLGLKMQGLVILLEDQFQAGMPAFMDKARDSQGEIRSFVFVVEIRPTPPDYGTSAMICPVSNGPIVNNPPPCDPNLATCTQPPPCDPALGNCNPPTGGPQLFAGSLETARAALVASANMVGVMRDSITPPNIITVDPGSLVFEETTRSMVVKSLAGIERFVFLGMPGDAMTIAMKEGVPLVTPKGNGGTTLPPPDSGLVSGDTTRPSPYRGALAVLKEMLAGKGNEVRVMTPNGPQPAKVNPESVVSDGTLTTGVDASNAARIFVFMGAKEDPTRPMLTPDGFVGVEPKPSMAAQ